MPFLLLFLLSWLMFWLFADRKNWRKYAPVSMLAMLMSFASDSLTAMYTLWDYRDTTGLLPLSVIRILDDIGIYPVAAYLFIQYMPSQKTARQWLYFLSWSSGVILLEALFVYQGWMVHMLWWNICLSYLADWLIFLVLLSFAQSYQGTKSSQKQPDILDALKQYGLTLDFLSEKKEADVFLLEVQPGSRVGAHTHSGDEFAVILQGNLEISVGTERQVYSAGQCLSINRHVVHSAANTDNCEVALALFIVLSSGLQQKLRAHTLDQLLLSNEPLRL